MVFERAVEMWNPIINGLRYIFLRAVGVCFGRLYELFINV